MGTNCASILVKLRKGLTAARVAQAVDEFYVSRGARGGPPELQPKPGGRRSKLLTLGVAISHPWEEDVGDGGKPRWVSIIDSERYSANVALAAALAAALDTSTHWVFIGDVSGTYEVLEFGPRIRKRPADCLEYYEQLDPGTKAWLFRSYTHVRDTSYVAVPSEELDAQARVVVRQLDGEDLAVVEVEAPAVLVKDEWKQRRKDLVAVRDGAKRLGPWPREAVFGAWFRSVLRDDRQAAHLNVALQGVTLKDWKKQWNAFDDFNLVQTIWSELEALPAADSRPPAKLFAAARADDRDAAAAVAVHASLTGNPLLCRWATAVADGRSWVAAFYRDKVSL